jgi:uncharacterized protein (TIGR03382 family)
MPPNWAVPDRMKVEVLRSTPMKCPRPVAAIVACVLLAGTGAFAQDEAPPAITKITVSTTNTCSTSPTPWVFGVDPCLEEGDLVWVCVELQKDAWGDPNAQATQTDQSILLTMVSTWVPFVQGGVSYGPEPPIVPTDRNGAGGLGGGYYIFPQPVGRRTITVSVPYLIPEFNGRNQARLRGLIDYDIRWLVEITARIGNPDSEGTGGTMDDFTICAVENPNLNPGNPPPFADAGPDQTVAMSSTVILNGSRSFDRTNTGFAPGDTQVFDKDALSYTWSWVSGPERVDPQPVPGEPPGSPLAQVILDVLTTIDQPYVYRLLVSDGVNPIPSADEVRIFVVPSIPVNVAPQAVITGPMQAVTVGQRVQLNGAGSSDANGDRLTFLWRQTNEAGGELSADELTRVFQPLSNVEAATVVWIPTAAGRYYFTLLVRDPDELTGTARIAVDVLAASGAQAIQKDSGAADPPITDAGATDQGAPVTSAAPAACGGGGVFPLAVLPLAMLFMRRRGV